MAEKLKHILDEPLVRAIGAEIKRVHRSFDERAFVLDANRGLSALELTPRAGHIADAMHAHLPKDYAKASQILMRSLGPPLERSDQFVMSVLRYMPHVFFVARHGLDHFEESMALQYELTQRFSAEFSIRSFLVKYPDQTYARLTEWARDPNVHVRRLVSEGTRPRLPWAMRLRAFQEDPSPVIRLLEMLKDDPERYVQRSVANSVNDIAKDHPEVAIDLCRRWSKRASASRRYIVEHALRTLVKRGDTRALDVIGYASAPEVAVRGAKVDARRVSIGSALRFSFDLASTAKREQELLVDYVVHYVKADGTRRPKVFKLKTVRLRPREVVHLERNLSFVQRSTRVHYPGRHAIELSINGKRYPLCEFDVRG